MYVCVGWGDLVITTTKHIFADSQIQFSEADRESTSKTTYVLIDIFGGG
jgi:hypothetical protein